MKDRLSDEQIEAILEALDEAIAEGPWDKSNFLKAIGKKLAGVREDFLLQLGASSPEQLKAELNISNQFALRSGQQEVYVSLYTSDGSNIQSWERIIANLPSQMISRPIYGSEDNIKALLQTKENRQNEAYVAIYIDKNDILPLSPEKSPIDKLGTRLLSLKDKSLSIDNISRFVHLSGIYRLERNRLVKAS